MATLKSKRKQEELREAIVKEETPIAEEAVSEEVTSSPYMNEAEQTALAEQHEKDVAESKKVSIEKMQKAVEVVQEQFNLCDKDFSINGFADKGSKCQLSMSNADFDIVITVKDNEKYQIF